MEVHDDEAVARGTNLPISRKHAREVARFIKGDDVDAAKDKLQRVIDKEQPVPYTRHNKGQAHRSGDMDSGRYPVKTAEEMRQVVHSAAKNAEDQGMDPEALYVSGVHVGQGNRYQTPKRHRGERKKAAHVTVKVGER